jgi:hypothetical protein
MPWYELTSDVMVRGTSRSTGEVLDLTEGEGHLLVGLARAKPSTGPYSVRSPEPLLEAPTPAPSAPVECEIKRSPTRRTSKSAPKED